MGSAAAGVQSSSSAWGAGEGGRLALAFLPSQCCRRSSRLASRSRTDVRVMLGAARRMSLNGLRMPMPTLEGLPLAAVAPLSLSLCPCDCSSRSSSPRMGVGDCAVTGAAGAWRMVPTSGFRRNGSTIAGREALDTGPAVAVPTPAATAAVRDTSWSW